MKFNPTEATEQEIFNFLDGALSEYETTESRWAFKPLTLSLNPSEDIPHAINELVDTLPQDARKRWHDAVISLLAQCTAKEEDRILKLITLAVLRSSTTLLETMTKLFQQGSPSAKLIDRAIDAVLELPVQPSSLECFKTLARSEHFPYSSSGTVLIFLCRLEPENWLGHAELLEAELNELMDNIAKYPDVITHYAERVLQAIGLEILARDWYKLFGRADLDWFRREIFAIDEPLVTLEESSLSSKLFEGEHSSVRLSLSDALLNLGENLVNLPIVYDNERYVESSGAWQLEIAENSARIPANLIENDRASNAAALVKILSGVEEEGVFSRTSPRFNQSVLEALGQLVLDSPVKTIVPMDQADVEGYGKQVTNAVQFIRSWQVKSDDSLSPDSGNFNFEITGNTVRMPSEIHQAYGRVSDVVTLVELMRLSGEQAVPLEGWDSQQLHKAQIRAIGQIFSTAINGCS